MPTRRDFIMKAGLASAAIIAPNFLMAETKKNKKIKFSKKSITKPIVISTWDHGIPANEAAWKILKNNGRALDAVEQGVRVPEADPKVTSVGYGGFPDRDGRVTLDASIMDEYGNCGSVAFLENIMHPISVARMVMEKTPHVMIVGEGAYKFAVDNGFKKENLLTEESRQRWEKWRLENKYNPINWNNHDTIGMIAMDNSGNLSGACTTSGLAWKYHGRVGDSPIIGAGMYVDNEVGGAVATGKGESVIKIAGSFLIVELMRNGKSPQEACEEAIGRIVKKQNDHKEFQVGFLALNKNGEYGAYSLQKEFKYALYSNDKNTLNISDYFLKG